MLGAPNPEILRKHLKGDNSALFEKYVEECKKTPYLHVSSKTDLPKRKYCRLYWGMKDSIDILIEAEKKFILLSSTDEDDGEWEKKWNEYKNGGRPWGEIIKGTTGKVFDKFKEICKTKAKKLVNDNEDKEYIHVTNYCARDKTIKDELKKQGIKLLRKENNSGEWEKRLRDYNNTDYGATFENHQEIRDISELQRKCEEATEFRTANNGWKEKIEAVKKHCSTESEN